MTRSTTTRPLALIMATALVLAIPLCGVAADGQTPAPAGADQAQTEDRQAPRRGRLRFRDGPTCMCGQGLSEADIEQTENDRRRELPRR